MRAGLLTSPVSLEGYWQRLVRILPQDIATEICRIASHAIALHPVPQPTLSRLQRRWYDSIACGAPDYTIYALPTYLAEVWYCWACYSRHYLRELAKHAHGLLTGRVLDLGCGAGYSTAAIAETWPRCSALATNVKGSAQWELCKSMSDEYGFQLHRDAAGAGKADVVFASEYFEHFDEPVAHLRAVLDCSGAHILIIANTFTSPAIGHFPEYKHNGGLLTGKAMSRAFNVALFNAGFRQQRFGFWNNRPTVWIRS